MNPKVKLALYLVLVTALSVLGYGLYSSLQSPPAPAPAPAAVAPPSVPADTNQIAATNAPSTNAATNAATAATATNAPADPTAPTAPTAPTPPTPAAAAEDNEFVARAPSRNLGRATAYGVSMFFTLVGLSILVARDLSRYFAGRVEDFIFNDNLEGMKDPEYEEAERVWAKGEHLDAVRLMRSYLNKHPREQYVALRIAEIYENDLHNHLAAALEYEEVLKKRLPAERWGWAAIHLANLYSGKLDKIPEATRLLRRIVDEYGQTAAAKKARERLGIPEPVAEITPAVEAQLAAQETAGDADATEATKPPPSHNLPKGFRPK